MSLALIRDMLRLLSQTAESGIYASAQNEVALLSELVEEVVDMVARIREEIDYLENADEIEDLLSQVFEWAGTIEEEPDNTMAWMELKDAVDTAMQYI